MMRGQDASTGRAGIAVPRNGLRMACVYAVYFCGPGLYQSYFPIWLREHTLSDSQIAIILAAPLLIRIVSSRLFGRIADQAADRRKPVRILAALVLAGGLVLRQTDGFWPILLASAFMLLFWNAVTPMNDAITLSLLRRGLVRDYGRIRAGGSASFIAANIAGGYILAYGGPDLVLLALMVVLAAFNGAVWLIPKTTGAPSQRATLDPLILRRPAFLAAVLVGALVQASHSAFNGFGTLYLRSLGYQDASLGFVVSIATAAEVAMFMASPWVTRFVGPIGLLTMAAAGGLVRWSLLALDPSPAVLVLLQLCQAATFSASAMGVMGFIAATVGEERAGSAQSTYAAMLAGMAALVTLISGPVFARTGGGVFLVAAALPALGLLILAVMGRRMRGLLAASERR